MWIFLLLVVIAIPIVAHFYKVNKRIELKEELEQLILKADRDGGSELQRRVKMFCQDNNFSQEEFMGIRKNLYYRLAENDDLFALKMAWAFALDDQNRTAEVRYLTRAAELGDAECMYWLAVTLSNQEADPEYYDLEKSFFWCKQAAEHGYDDAVIRVIRAYDEGVGVKEDKEKAFAMAKEYADRGFSECALFLADVYTEDITSPRYNKAKAIKILERVMLRGEPEYFASAARKLGYIYGAPYLINSSSIIDEFSDRRKAAYCFALSYIIDQYEGALDNLNKTGYKYTDFEYERWISDAKALRYNPM